MSNYKAQMSNQVQNSKDKSAYVVLAFSLPAEQILWQAGHLDFNCHLDFDIWVCSIFGF
jgi:hypothetical protein